MIIILAIIMAVIFFMVFFLVFPTVIFFVVFFEFSSVLFIMYSLLRSITGLINTVFVWYVRNHT